MAELTGGRCLCRCCDRTFRNLAAFDAHRPDRDGCGDPTAAGLVERGGLWATPEGHAAAEHFRQHRHSGRAGTRRSPQSAEQPQALPEVPHGRL
jgi:hypothetical protein